MKILIREGTILEALEVEHQIPEFEIKRTLNDYNSQLSNLQSHILIAEEEGKLVGCKIGYQKSKDEFYSWLGGVLPEYRKKKIGTYLREEQERWAATQGYRFISVDSYNKFSAMICMLISSGYMISSFESNAKTLRSKVGFTKDIAKSA